MLPQLQTLPADGGGIIDSAFYWSTTELEGTTYYAYLLNFYGQASNVNYGDKVLANYDVRAVFAF